MATPVVDGPLISTMGAGDRDRVGPGAHSCLSCSVAACRLGAHPEEMGFSQQVSEGPGSVRRNVQPDSLGAG